ncbi:GNAT family N-acetyltransferase [Streptomyces sp. ISL-36]|uniref:GNAT family N-acetyltransferase n=1 Tax=Streptomyces sp. ISL-36 TaxID=2819182 RepID=UPI001BE6CB1C|nr:GNAT family N-acetyltransferase [Streptomyces sp. ISL-36]MBT2439998.1 GNAT family N-acetyltransferase [Streptomyces sp. ISL-36]
MDIRDVDIRDVGIRDVAIRDVPEAHLDRALDLVYLVFHQRPDEEKRKHHRELLLPCERIGAYDGETLVGFVAAHRFALSVPGGELPCPGLTFVSVAPTHRRRGVLSALLAEVYRRCAERAVPIAALWASEDAIYGRFGFGPATQGATVEIDSRRPLALRIDPDDRPLRLIDPADAPAVVGPYHEATRAHRAGRIARDEERWSGEWLVDEDEEDDELSPPRIVALGEPLAGYAVYRTRSGNEETGTPGLVRVDEVEADTPAVAAALWRYLASIDLTGTVRAWGRPLDDPLLLFAADRDQVKVTGVYPALWLRLIDVRAVLTARSWAARAELVLEVHDSRIPANSGRFRLTADAGRARYEPTADPADLALDVRDLGACCLGGTRVVDLVAAGLVEEHTPGAAEAFDAALRTARLPHTDDEFY